jgi:hypothetical protein
MHRELIGDRRELRACNRSSAVILAVEGAFSGPNLAGPAVTLEQPTMVSRGSQSLSTGFSHPNTRLSALETCLSFLATPPRGISCLRGHCYISVTDSDHTLWHILQQEALDRV